MSITSISVSYRADRQKWQVRYWESGTRKRPLFDSEKEAQTFAGNLERAGQPEDQNSITIDAALKSYFRDVTMTKKSRTSQKNDQRYFNLFFHFMTVDRGLTRLASVKLQDLEAFQLWLPDNSDMGASSVNRAFHSIRHMFKKHVQWKTLGASPCIYLDNLAADENERRPMTPAEFERMFKHAPGWFKPVLTFIHLTGTPPSSVERLTWRDVSLANRTYTIQREKGGRKKRIEIPMIDAVHELLSRQRARFRDSCESVFRNEHNAPLTASWCSKAGTKAVRRAGLTGVTLYCLRHALASDMTSANVATELVRRAMGHSSISTTQRYAKRAGTQSVANALTLVRGGLVSPQCHQASPESDTSEKAAGV